MEQSELLRLVIRCFESLKFPYLITGAIASIAYGEPRLTIDIDIVADIKEEHIKALKKYFPKKDFYLDEDMIKKAILLKHSFNIIHPASGLKIDVIISKMDDFDKSQFSRIKRIKALEDAEANFASPEDVIIKKMEYYREGSSEKHLRDITGILKISKEMIDYNYISLWAKRLGLEDIWQAVQKRISEG